MADAWSDTETGADTSTTGITVSVSDGDVERRTSDFRQIGNFGRHAATDEQQAFFAAASGTGTGTGTATATGTGTATATGTDWPSVEEGGGSQTAGAEASDALVGRQNHFIYYVLRTNFLIHLSPLSSTLL